MHLLVLLPTFPRIPRLTPPMRATVGATNAIQTQGIVIIYCIVSFMMDSCYHVAPCCVTTWGTLVVLTFLCIMQGSHALGVGQLPA